MALRIMCASMGSIFWGILFASTVHCKNVKPIQQVDFWLVVMMVVAASLLYFGAFLSYSKRAHDD